MCSDRGLSRHELRGNIGVKLARVRVDLSAPYPPLDDDLCDL